MRTDKNYQSILNQLSIIPVSYLQQVDNYLTNLTKQINEKKRNRTAILDLAGSWSDFSENDFQEYLLAAKQVREDMFHKDIEL